ncbi:uncharacterized protein LOC109718063 [Ananas comosus]|uniref:Uncharacterized protein LOC109718063 n=1 Tax=Ananas comosus TaxID=4615 RepID=A0A6P5G1U2_ANACO|nr:uncharacterized protein LOC109718063 [Ananas comosus]
MIQSFHQMASLLSVKLSSSNFLLWKSQIYPLIRSAHLLHHIEEDAPTKMILKGDKEEENPEYTIWINNDGLLTSWLLGTMAEEVLGLVIGCNNVREIWKCLDEHFFDSTKEKEMHLKNQLAVLKGNQPLDEFIRKFKHSCDCLAAIQQPLDDVDKVFQLSRVLGSRYRTYNLVVLSKPPYPTFNEYIMGLKGFEQQLALEDEEEKAKAPNYAQAFIAQRGRGGCGRNNGGHNFNSRGRGFVQSGTYNNQGG